MKRRTIDETEAGFSLPELMIVIAILVVLAAIALPSILGSKQAAREQVAKSKLTAIGAAQTTFRTLLKKGRYATLDELQTTMSGGTPLLSTTDLIVPGWSISLIEGETGDTTFGLKAAPTAGNNRTVVYAIFEDQVLRRCPTRGTPSRQCEAITE